MFFLLLQKTDFQWKDDQLCHILRFPFFTENQPPTSQSQTQFCCSCSGESMAGNIIGFENRGNNHSQRGNPTHPPTRALRRGEILKGGSQESSRYKYKRDNSCVCISDSRAWLLHAKYLLPAPERNCGSSSPQKRENELTWQHLEGGRQQGQAL